MLHHVHDNSVYCYSGWIQQTFFIHKKSASQKLQCKVFEYSGRIFVFILSVQKKDAPLFTCQEETGGDASFGLVSRVSIFFEFCTFSVNICLWFMKVSCTYSIWTSVCNSLIAGEMNCFKFDKQDLTKIGPNCEHLLRLTCSTTFRAPADTKTPAPAPAERIVSRSCFESFANNNLCFS